MLDRAGSLPPGHPDEFAGQAISPAEQIRVHLERKKRQGIGWEHAWPYAVGRVRWPHDREERHEWKRTIAWAEPAFHAAWDGDLPACDMSALVIFEIDVVYVSG